MLLNLNYNNDFSPITPGKTLAVRSNLSQQVNKLILQQQQEGVSYSAKNSPHNG